MVAAAHEEDWPVSREHDAIRTKGIEAHVDAFGQLISGPVLAEARIDDSRNFANDVLLPRDGSDTLFPVFHGVRVMRRAANAATVVQNEQGLRRFSRKFRGVSNLRAAHAEIERKALIAQVANRIDEFRLQAITGGTFRCVENGADSLDGVLARESIDVGTEVVG